MGTDYYDKVRGHEERNALAELAEEMNRIKNILSGDAGKEEGK